MKIRKIIYISVGVLLIIVNILLDITDTDLRSDVSDAYSVGYFIGSHILFVAGLFFLIAAFKLNRKIRQKKLNNYLKKEIDEIGNS